MMGMNINTHVPFLTFKKNALVFSNGGRVYLVQTLPARSGEYVLAESISGERFRYLAPPLALTEKRRKTAFDEPLCMRASVAGKDTLITWVTAEAGLSIARVKKPGHWELLHHVAALRQPGVVFPAGPGESGGEKKLFVFYVSGHATIAVGTVSGKQGRFHEIGAVVRLRRGSEYGPLQILAVEATDEGLLLFYSAIDGWGFPSVSALLVDAAHPDTVLWRSDTPLWEVPLVVPPVAPVLLGLVKVGRRRLLYFERPGGALEVIALPDVRIRLFPKLTRQPAALRRKTTSIVSPELVRFAGNPLLEPRPENQWESFAVFNPAALHLDGRVHLLYRAQGSDGTSVLGYASSHDGIHFLERLQRPVYIPTRDFDTRTALADTCPYPFVSGGGYGGCEDPRLTLIEDRVYLIYVAFDGARPPGVALTSIRKEDFIARRWTWRPPKLISRPGKIQKNWVLFPEKINGRFAVLHGMSPSIQIEYVDSLDDLGDGKYIESLESHGGGGYVRPERRHFWDNIVRGAGAPPLRTRAGWLVFYHAMDFRDPGKYKVGAMLLDLSHPETIVARAKRPILEPEAPYENNGHKSGVIYVCGAVEKDGILFVYYGASDRSAAVAAAPLDDFLDDLLAERQPLLQSVPQSLHSS